MSATSESKCTHSGLARDSGTSVAAIRDAVGKEDAEVARYIVTPLGALHDSDSDMGQLLLTFRVHRAMSKEEAKYCLRITETWDKRHPNPEKLHRGYFERQKYSIAESWQTSIQ